MIIRNIKLEDAEKFLDMLLALDNETEYMMLEPNERIVDVNKQKEVIHQTIEGKNLLLIAEENNKIVGFLSVERGIPKRIKHTGYIVIGIRKDFQKQGIGTRFFKELELWAKENSITRLELTVMCHNEAGKRLYERAGFTVEGIKKNSMIVNEKYIDEFYMCKLL